jgi:hypothetical protein
LKSLYFSEQIKTDKIEKIIAGWKQKAPQTGVLAFLPEADKENIPIIQNIFKKENIPLAGAVFPEIIINNQFKKNGIILLGFSEMPWFQFFGPFAESPEILQEQVKNLSDAAGSQIRGNVETTLFMIFDSMIPNIGTILDELYLGLADRVHYMGVNAGSETFKSIPCLFDNSSIIQNGLLALLLKNHPGAILEHGYRAPAQMISATVTHGNRIISIDWKPAFEVYQEMAKTHYNVIINKENFYQNGVHFPFGILRANGEIVVRIPVALEDDGSLFCVGEVPANSVLTLLSAPEIDIEKTIKTIAEGLQEMGGPGENKSLLTFYCAGRRHHIGKTSVEELNKLKQETNVNKIFGALSLGEIGATLKGGYPLFHNATLVCCYWND